MSMLHYDQDQRAVREQWDATILDGSTIPNGFVQSWAELLGKVA